MAGVGGAADISARKVDLPKALSARDDEAEVEHFVDSRLAQSPACPHGASTWIVSPRGQQRGQPGDGRTRLRGLLPMFEPLVQAGLEQLRRQTHWHADETRWEVFERLDGKVGHRCCLWGFITGAVTSPTGHCKHARL